MKTTLLVILCLLVIAGATMVMPVAAVGSIANITGNPEDYISINEQGDISGWQFTQDFLNVNSTDCNLTVTSNHIGWTVGVSDANLTTSYPGHMTEYDPNTLAYVSDKHLINAMQIDGDNAHLTNYTATLVTLGHDSQVIWKGASDPQGIGHFQNIPITIQQQVDNADEHLMGGHVYRIVVTFTASIL